MFEWYPVDKTIIVQKEYKYKKEIQYIYWKV